jgi:hypothetical protein
MCHPNRVQARSASLLQTQSRTSLLGAENNLAAVSFTVIDTQVYEKHGDRRFQHSRARLPIAVADCEPVLDLEKGEDRLLQGCEPARLLRQHPLR